MNDALGMPQSVLVLGGGSEIGRALLRRLIAARTKRIVLGGRRGSAALDQTAAEARERGAAVDVVEFDASEPTTAADAVDEAFDRYGDLDLVVFAFGLLGEPAELEADPLAAETIATVNYTSSVVAGLATARHLRAQGHGTMLVMSSVAGVRTRKSNFVYGSTKAGADAFFQGLGDALHGSGPRVVIVRPGFVHTRMTAGLRPAPFATDAETVAEAIVAGLTKGSSIIWVPGVLRWVFLGFRMLPRSVWRQMRA